jgi:hypothetical protein
MPADLAQRSHETNEGRELEERMTRISNTTRIATFMLPLETNPRDR